MGCPCILLANRGGDMITVAWSLNLSDQKATSMQTASMMTSGNFRAQITVHGACYAVAVIMSGTCSLNDQMR